MGIENVAAKRTQSSDAGTEGRSSKTDEAAKSTAAQNQSGADGTVFKKTGTTPEPTALTFAPLPVNYGSYHDQMHADLNNLAANPNKQTAAAVLKDTSWWENYDSKNGGAASAAIAKDLGVQAGKLQDAIAKGDKGAAEEATAGLSKDLVQSEGAYWQAHHNTGGGNGDPPKGAHTDSEGNASQWQVHLGKGKQQKGIGGSGNVDNATVTQEGPNKTLYQTTGGAWGDSLIGAKEAIGTAKGDVSPTATHFQSDSTFNLDANYIKYGNEFEKDMIVTEPGGKHSVIGTQINVKTGEVDYWNQQQYLKNGKGWVDEGSITGGAPLKADTNYNLQIDAHITGSQYVYDGYTLNGKTLKPTSQTAFAETHSTWSPEFIQQTQEDLLGSAPNHTTIGATISNETSSSW
jgi:hypothetical protein